jgi:hypothetical protein
VTPAEPRRIPRRPPQRRQAAPAREGFDERDPLGRMALYSEPEPEPEPPATGLVVECSSCLAETPVSPFALARATLPFSIHLPLVRRYSSFMRCPACGRRTWLRIGYRT